ncbi:hypothetical protein ACP4OV_011170 [Aristida adscensionis]
MSGREDRSKVMDKGKGIKDGSNDPDSKPQVADLLEKLQLTAEEAEAVELSDEEDEGEQANKVFSLIGKVLSPNTLHISTIMKAMRPAWGNPKDPTARSVGEKQENLFVADFGCASDRDRALDGSPWVVGRHAMLLQEFNAALRPSEVRFDRMAIWIRFLNLPLGWMTRKGGMKLAGMVGMADRVDVDANNKVSGAFLRARAFIEVHKPLRRGVLLNTDRKGKQEWINIQYEKLPFYCFSCGIIGHTELECANPASRDANGKLPYDLKLRAHEERRRRFQSFSEAASETSWSESSGRYGHGFSASVKSDEREKSGEIRADSKRNDEQDEVQSPLKEAPVVKEQQAANF